MTTPVQTRLMFRSPIPVGQDALGWIGGGGTLRDGPYLPAAPLRVFGSYALVYLLGGSGRYVDANGHRQRVLPGSMILVFPELAHTYGPDAGEPWHELYLTFEGQVFDLWRQAGLIDETRPVVTLHPVAAWRARLEGIVFAAPPFTAAARAAEVCRLLEILTEIKGGGEDADERSGWLAQATALLESRLEEDIGLPEVAEQVGMPYETFRRYFVRETGLSPGRYRAERRLSAACSLLRQTHLPMRQIAELTGFADESTFSRRFHQAKGQTPRQFRQGRPSGPQHAVTDRLRRAEDKD